MIAIPSAAPRAPRVGFLGVGWLLGVLGEVR